MELYAWSNVCLLGWVCSSVLLLEIAMSTPLSRAPVKLEEIERELRKCPDFQLYLIAQTRQDQLRMERVLLDIPSFKLRLTLRNSITLATRLSPENLAPQ
jgi:hypothetical protein